MLLSRDMFDLDCKEEKWAGKLLLNSDEVQPQKKYFKINIKTFKLTIPQGHQWSS